MIKLVLTAAGMIASAAPAPAGQNHYQPTAQDLRDGRCTRQQVHTPAGKIVHNAPIIRCDGTALASRASAPHPVHGDSIVSRSGKTRSAR